MNLLGTSIVGGSRGLAGSDCFRATAPGTGTALEPAFFAASRDEVDRAVTLATEAFEVYGRLSGAARGELLRRIAAQLESVEPGLIERAHLETALPVVRLRGEIGRTCSQLRLFAQVVEEGSWTTPRIDHGDPNRKPLPKPDVRSMLRPLGPVVVFGASNFPFAFSVAGGDTASALAAGNPVIVKAHPAHPGTSELVGLAIRASISELGLHEGCFSLLFDSRNRVGEELVRHPQIKAGAFTGSLPAGRALFHMAVNRAEPIPFYSEMSSTNPLFILPRALEEFGEKIAEGLFGSFTLGAGQFCTKPGLVFLVRGKAADDFVNALRSKVAESAPSTLLTPGIAEHYRGSLEVRRGNLGTRLLAMGAPASETLATTAVTALLQSEAERFLENPMLAEEHFGPSTLIVECQSSQEFLRCAAVLGGQLTATVHGTEQEIREYADLLRRLEAKAGRVIFNGYPTGVEVGHAMVHGGPYPSTTDVRMTSVGTMAIHRFARPICYQDCPESILPEELRDDNPIGLWRLVDGRFSDAKSC